MALFAAWFCCWLRCAHMQLKIQHNNQQELVNAIKAGIDWCVTKISTINMNNTERTQRNNNQPDGHERYVSSKMLRSHTPHKSSLEHPSQIIYSFVCLSQHRKKQHEYHRESQQGGRRSGRKDDKIENTFDIIWRAQCYQS